MSNITATEIFAQATFNTSTIEVESFGGEVTIRELTAREASRVISIVESDGLRSNAMAVAFGVLNEDGKRVFNDAHVEKIMDKIKIQDIAKVAMAILALSDPEAAEEK